jgi:hypothetical protein
MTLVVVPEELLKLAQVQCHKLWNNETLRTKLDTPSASQLQGNIHHLQSELNKDMLLWTHMCQNPTRHYHGYMKQSRHLCYKILY